MSKTESEAVLRVLTVYSALNSFPLDSFICLKKAAGISPVDLKEKTTERNLDIIPYWSTTGGSLFQAISEFNSLIGLIMSA